ncbi:MAG: hypothetical protein IPP10_08085 [Candidatus Competibacteraceae bacterium]|jgi:hypothetical protein|nr:hypothetical protein [Candidatus Competibacteraceae bacterium]MBK7983010.1 hypothetical protein [Candidatus Competibacteraceae bacterium]MBK8898438.1 hypothetical protein [Candidatus Competibacteraceae bacterium]MBK8962248.1 hypothetical protein [Candidatus Competibacteraceae bacterium]MBK9951464.1 hypothetical protein [Candidatus Competibacteraceae bacterium]
MKSMWRAFALDKLDRFKSPWFYWHTGRKRVAIASLIVSTLAMWTAFVLAAGFSLWSIIIAVLLDAVGFWLALAYLLFLRSHLPGFTGLQSIADFFIVNQLAIPLLIGFFATRAATYWVAKACGHLPPNPKPPDEPPP